MKNIESELQEFYSNLRKNDEKLIDNFGLNKFINNLEGEIAKYQANSDESVKKDALYDCAGTIYHMMNAVKNYRLNRGVEKDIKANPINLRKEDLIFRNLFIMYNHLIFSLYTKSEEKREASNK